MLTHQAKHAYKLEWPHYERWTVLSTRQDDMMYITNLKKSVGKMIGDVGEAKSGNGYSYRVIKSGVEVDGFKTRGAAIEALLEVTH